MGSERYHRDPDLAWQELNGEILILATEQGKVHELNEVAATIWKALEHPVSRDELVEQLVANFEVELEQVVADVEQVLEQWQALQLVRKVS